MKFYILTFVLAALVVVDCHHLFVGNNIQRPLVYHHTVEFKTKGYERIENMNYTLPNLSSRSIQGILAFDLTFSEAVANVTTGGLGFNYVNIRMKSQRGRDLYYDVYIFA